MGSEQSNIDQQVGKEKDVFLKSTLDVDEEETKLDGFKDFVISGGFDGDICFWDYHTGNLLRRFQNYRTPLYEQDQGNYRVNYNEYANDILQIESVGKDRIIVSSRDGVLREYSISTSGQIYLTKEFIGHHINPRARYSDVFGFDICEKRRIMISGSDDVTVRMWSLDDDDSTDKNGRNSAKLLHTFNGNAEAIGGIKILGNNNAVASSDMWGMIIKHDLNKTSSMVFQPTRGGARAHGGCIFSIDYSESYNCLFSCSADKTVKFFDIRNCLETKCLNSSEHKKGFQGLMYLEDSHELFVGEGTTRGLPSRVADILIYDIRNTKKVKCRWTAHECDIHRFVRIRESLNDKNIRIMTCSRDNTIGIWERESNDTKFKFVRRMEEKSPVPGICFMNQESQFWKFDERFVEEKEDVFERFLFSCENEEDEENIVVNVIGQRLKIPKLFLYF